MKWYVFCLFLQIHVLSPFLVVYSLWRLVGRDFVLCLEVLMDRRGFFHAFGGSAAAASWAGTQSAVRADGYRRCDQVHVKLSEHEIDKWVQPLPFPPVLPLRVVQQQSESRSLAGWGAETGLDDALAEVPCVS